jgi:hypothetical protein
MSLHREEGMGPRYSTTVTSAAGPDLPTCSQPPGEALGRLATSISHQNMRCRRKEREANPQLQPRTSTNPWAKLQSSWSSLHGAQRKDPLIDIGEMLLVGRVKAAKVLAVVEGGARVRLCLLKAI